MLAKKTTDWPSMGSIMLSVILALSAGAVAWGATKADLRNTEEKAIAVQAQLEKVKEDVNEIKVNNATSRQSLEDISKNIDSLARELERLNRSIEGMWRTNHGK